MNVLEYFNNGFCLRLAITLAHFLWQATAVAVIAGVAGALLRKSNPVLRYWVFLTALAVMAICPLVTFPLVGSPAIEPAAPAAVAVVKVDIAPVAPPHAAMPPVMPSARQTETPIDSALPERLVAPAPTPKAIVPVAAPLAPTVTPAQPSVDYWKMLSPYAAGCYLLGVLLMLVRLLVGLHGGLRLREASEPVTDSSLLTMLARQAKSLGLRFMPAVACCRKVAVPVVVGVLRPMILLPLSVTTGLSAEQVEAILAHELAHIRRYDPLVNLLQRLVETFLFYHPAVWFVSRRIRLERENCCDDLAVAAGTEPYAYAQSLLHLAQKSLEGVENRRNRPAVTIGATDRPSQLRSRIGRLLGASEEGVRLARTWPVAVMLLLATAAIITVMSCSPGQPETSKPAATQPAARSGYVEVQVAIRTRQYQQGDEINSGEFQVLHEFRWPVPGDGKAEKLRLTAHDGTQLDVSWSGVTPLPKGEKGFLFRDFTWSLPAPIVNRANGESRTFRPLTEAKRAFTSDFDLLVTSVEWGDAAHQPSTVPTPALVIRARWVESAEIPATQPATSPTSAPAASANVPNDLVDFGKHAFEVLGKQDAHAVASLLAKGLAYESLPVDMQKVNSDSLRLQDVYVAGDQALLIGSPLVWEEWQYKPPVLYLHASLTAKGWAINSWQVSDFDDTAISKAFLLAHPKAKHVYEAPPFTAPPGGRLFPMCIVDDSTGKPLASAIIDAWADGEQYTLIADGDGMVYVPMTAQRPANLSPYKPTLEVNAYYGGYVPTRYNPYESIPESFTLRMHRGKTIGGTIQDEDGRPIANAIVDTWPVFPNPQLPLYPNHRSSMAASDQQGRWRLTGVPVDTHAVFVRIGHPDYISDREWHGAGPMPGLLDHTNVMVLKQSDITVSGVVYGPDGKPLAGAKVYQGKNRAGIQFPDVKTDAIGRYAFPQTPAGKLTVFATAPGCSPQLVEVDAQKGIAPVDLHLSPGNTIRGRLVDSNGKPLEGIYVSVDTWRGRLTLRWGMRTDSDGRFEWKDAPPDGVVLKFGKDDGSVGVTRPIAPSKDLQTITMSADFESWATLNKAPATQPAKSATSAPAVRATSKPAANISVLVARKIKRVDIDNVAMGDAIEQVRKESVVNIHVNWQALNSIAVDKKTPVTVKLENATLGEVLEAILTSAAGPHMLTYEDGYGDNVVTITTADDAGHGQPVNRTQDVNDLLAPGGGFTAEGLEKLIKEKVAPGSWGTPQGWGAITLFHGQFIITQTADAQEAIEKLLGNLRRQRHWVTSPASQPATTATSAPATKVTEDEDRKYLHGVADKLKEAVGGIWEIYDKPHERGLVLYCDVSNTTSPRVNTHYAVYLSPWTEESRARWNSPLAQVHYEPIASNDRCTLLLTGVEDKEFSNKIIAALGLVRLSAQLATQPAGAKLEFRVAMVNPNSGIPSLLAKEELNDAMAALDKGQVGRWWIGGAADTKEPKYVWLPIRSAIATYVNLVTGHYKDKEYVLLSNQPATTMLADGWGLKSVYRDVDGSNQPIVGCKFDENGAKRFLALTKANIDKPLAIIVDGEVYSAPVVRSAISDTAAITGKFTDKDVQHLVALLKTGMKATHPATSATSAPATRAAGDVDPSNATATVLATIAEVVALGDPSTRIAVEKDVREAFKVATRISQDDLEKICQDIRSQGENWKYTEETVPAKNFVFTTRLRIYYFLTQPALDQAERDLLDRQRKDLLEMLDKLPDRMVAEFHAPKEIKGGLEAACTRSRGHFESLLESPFLRPSQRPLSPKEFEEIKATFRSEIDRLGAALAAALDADVAKGGYIPQNHLKTCENFVVTFHGMAMRTYLLRAFQSIEHLPETFPFGRPDSYGVRYRLGATGCLFLVVPQEVATQPTKSATSAPATQPIRPLAWRDEESEAIMAMSTEDRVKRIGTVSSHANAEPPEKFSDRGSLIPIPPGFHEDSSGARSGIVGHFYKNLRPGLTLVIRTRIKGDSCDAYWCENENSGRAFYDPPKSFAKGPLKQASTSASPTTSQSSPPTSAPVDPDAAWEAKVGQRITVEGEAVRHKNGIYLQRPSGDARPYFSIILEHVLPDLRGGARPLPVRVTGTLQLHKHTVTQAEVDQYKRDLAENTKQMQLRNLQAGQIIRDYSMDDAVVTILDVATQPATQPAEK